jgi:hypothetical protein
LAVAFLAKAHASPAPLPLLASGTLKGISGILRGGFYAKSQGRKAVS